MTLTHNEGVFYAAQLGYLLGVIKAAAITLKDSPDAVALTIAADLEHAEDEAEEYARTVSGRG